MATVTLFAAIVLMLVCPILLGATQAAPYRWVVVGLAVLALLLVVVGGVYFGVAPPR